MDWLFLIASLLLSLAFIFHAVSEGDTLGVVLGSAAMLLLVIAIILSSRYEEDPYDQRRNP